MVGEEAAEGFGEGVFVDEHLPGVRLIGVFKRDRNQ